MDCAYDRPGDVCGSGNLVVVLRWDRGCSTVDGKSSGDRSDNGAIVVIVVLAMDDREWDSIPASQLRKCQTNQYPEVHAPHSTASHQTSTRPTIRMPNPRPPSKHPRSDC